MISLLVTLIIGAMIVHAFTGGKRSEAIVQDGFGCLVLILAVAFLLLMLDC